MEKVKVEKEKVKVEKVKAVSAEENIMPAKSKAQQEAMAIAKFSPEKLYKRNKGLKKMSKNQLGDFASTPTTGLPLKVPKIRGSIKVPKIKAPNAKKLARVESVKSFIDSRNKAKKFM